MGMELVTCPACDPDRRESAWQSACSTCFGTGEVTGSVYWNWWFEWAMEYSRDRDEKELARGNEPTNGKAGDGNQPAG